MASSPSARRFSRDGCDMRTIIAIKPCPQGQQPGEQFVVPEAHAAALVMVGAAKYADADDSEEPSRRRRYVRRDLRADA